MSYSFKFYFKVYFIGIFELITRVMALKISSYSDPNLKLLL